jgi:hypothetical protein
MPRAARTKGRGDDTLAVNWATEGSMAADSLPSPPAVEISRCSPLLRPSCGVILRRPAPVAVRGYFRFRRRIQPVDATTDHCVGRRSVADEVPHTHVLHRRPEGPEVRAMEGRLDAAPIAHLFDRAHGSIRGIIERTGGFRPPQRGRSPIALTLAEREEIARSVADGQSIRSTTARLGRAPSTEPERPS